MNKYTKIIVAVCTLLVVLAIVFRPSGQLINKNGQVDLSHGYGAVYDEAIKNKQPLFIEFYGGY